MKCVICDVRPAQDGNGRCGHCEAVIKAERRRREPARPVKYITYKGMTVGLFPKRGDPGVLEVRAVDLAPARLPKGKTLDLNTYLPGFTREQIKRFKATIKRTHAA